MGGQVVTDPASTKAVAAERLPAETVSAPVSRPTPPPNSSRPFHQPRPPTFAKLGVASWLCNALQALCITRPTPVQAACIPPALSGRDVIGAAQTGTGKTVAFALPILQALAKDPHGVFAAVLTPTRELAFQIAQQMRALGAQVGVRAQVVVGGVDELAQATALEGRPHIVIATPGRLALMVDRLAENGINVFTRARFVVMDEADRLLEAEYLPSLATILDACSAEKRQTMMFSATMTPSIEKVQDLALKSGDTDAFRFDASANRFETVDALRQAYVFMPVNLKETHLVHLLKNVRPNDTCIIFVARCDVAEHLAAVLRVLGMQRVSAMHSEMKQTQRVEALQKLKGGIIRALIATDVASRGLDVPAVDLVVNYDFPRKTATYVHRVGRTARAGRGGLALSFVTQSDVDLVHAIEGDLERKLERLEEHDNSEAVMELLSATLKARQVAQLEITDNGFMARYDARREEGRTAAKKRKRKERRQMERAVRQDGRVPTKPTGVEE